MAAEHGIRLGHETLDGLERAGRLSPLLERFPWFYIGAEFCENLISDGTAGEAVFLQRAGRKVCVLTPLLSEKGVRALSSLFDRLAREARRGRLDPSRLEITANDFGAVELAAQKKLPFRVSAGRQLNFNAFLLERMTLKVLSARALAFFADLGVRRFEISATGRLPATNFGSRAFGFDPASFSITMFYPYLNLTTARTCPVGMPDIPPEVSVKGIECGRECRACAFSLSHPWVKEKLFVRGNTVYMQFAEKFYNSEKELARRRIDRLVYCPLP